MIQKLDKIIFNITKEGYELESNISQGVNEEEKC